jgi:hypothetical protein
MVIAFAARTFARVPLRRPARNRFAPGAACGQQQGRE